MPTVRAVLSTDQYVRVTSNLQAVVSVLLQSHRDSVRIVVNETQPAKNTEVFHELGGDDPILAIESTEYPIWALATSNTCALTITEQRSPVEISSRNSIGTAVFINDQTTPALDVRFLEELDITAIAADTVQNTYTFEALPGHGIITGYIVEITATDGSFIQARVLAVAGDIITIDSLITQVFPAGSTLTISNSDMRVDGSVTPKVFRIKPLPTQQGDLTRFIIGIQSSSSMDFSTFGSLPALTRGCLARIRQPNGNYVNLFTWKTNGEFIGRAFDHYFQSKVGGGLFSFVSRASYAGQHEHGVAIRLDGGGGLADPEELQIVVQDDLSTGLAVFACFAQGHALQEQ